MTRLVFTSGEMTLRFVFSRFPEQQSAMLPSDTRWGCESRFRLCFAAVARCPWTRAELCSLNWAEHANYFSEQTFLQNALIEAILVLETSLVQLRQYYVELRVYYVIINVFR